MVQTHSAPMTTAAKKYHVHSYILQNVKTLNVKRLVTLRCCSVHACLMFAHARCFPTPATAIFCLMWFNVDLNVQMTELTAFCRWSIKVPAWKITLSLSVCSYKVIGTRSGHQTFYLSLKVPLLRKFDTVVENCVAICEIYTFTFTISGGADVTDERSCCCVWMGFSQMNIIF